VTRTSQSAEPLYSALSVDPDLREMVDLFVEEMPQRIGNLLARLDTSDWEGLRRAAHQLKGAAGSYGFGPISPAAARVEDAIRKGSPEEEIRQAVDELIELCGRARAGLPAET